VLVLAPDADRDPRGGLAAEEKAKVPGRGHEGLLVGRGAAEAATLRLEHELGLALIPGPGDLLADGRVAGRKAEEEVGHGRVALEARRCALGPLAQRTAQRPADARRGQ